MMSTVLLRQYLTNTFRINMNYLVNYTSKQNRTDKLNLPLTRILTTKWKCPKEPASTIYQPKHLPKQQRIQARFKYMALPIPFPSLHDFQRDVKIEFRAGWDSDDPIWKRIDSNKNTDSVLTDALLHFVSNKIKWDQGYKHSFYEQNKQYNFL